MKSTSINIGNLSKLDTKKRSGAASMLKYARPYREICSWRFYCNNMYMQEARAEY